MSKRDYDEILAIFDISHEDFAEMMAGLETMHEMAQQLHMTHVQRCVDLNMSPTLAMLAMYQIARFQVLANMREGHIKPSDIRGSKITMEMLRDMRHPDGNYPKLGMDEDGNFRRVGTHKMQP